MNKFQKGLQLAVKYEFLLFVIAVGFLAGNIFAGQWQVNEDGPAHIYNAVISRELFLHPGTALNDVFELNSTPVPNFLGHAILSALTSFLPLSAADKILHCIIVFGMCFSFRFLCRQINPEQPFYSWFIFPFVYGSMYFLGFYNFDLGMFLFLLTSATWLWSEKKAKKTGPIFLVTVLSTLLLLCHLIPFLLFLLVAGSRTLIFLFRKEFRAFFITAGTLLLTILPAIILTAIYYAGRTENTGGYKWANPADTLDRLVRLKYLAIYVMEEGYYALVLSILLLAATVLAVFLFVKKKKSQSAEKNTGFIFWSSCWLFVLALVFFAPDDFGGSGALTIRLVEISEIFLLLFLAASALPKRIIMTMAVICFSVAMLLTQMRKEGAESLNTRANKVMGFSGSIAENSTGVYIPLVTNWLELHMGELAFAEKKSALLSNYETTHDFFVLKWSRNFKYNYTIGGLRSADLPCSLCYWPAKEDKPEKHIDYVLLCNEYCADTACYLRLTDSLEKYYVLKKTDVPFYLYQSRESISEGK